MTDIKMEVWHDDRSERRFVFGWTLTDDQTIEDIRPEAHRALDIELDHQWAEIQEES